MVAHAPGRAPKVQKNLVSIKNKKQKQKEKKKKEVYWVSKGLPTHKAQVGLTSVGDEMVLQFGKLRESVGTVWA